MKNLQRVLYVAAVLFAFCSCALIAPVTNQYEKAGTLKKGNFEVSGHASAYDLAGNGHIGKVNRNFGFRAGYGISDKFDLKVRYEKISPKIKSETNGGSINYVSVIPKIALIPNELSLVVPVSHYFGKGLWEENDWFNPDIYSIAPQLLYTLTNQRKTADVTIGVKGEAIIIGAPALFFGTTLGAGFSNNLDKWAVRPEVGLTLYPGSTAVGTAFLSYGVGFQYSFGRSR